MKLKRNLLILSVILIGVLIVVIGCLPTTPPAEEGDVPSGGSISIAGGAVTTNDTTPPLTISATDATYMAFSGNGTTWSSWVTYATTYSTFNITTGAGCTSGDGTKTVYVKFKNDDGESTKVYDSIILDTVKPTLLTAVYTDVGSGGTVNLSDTIVFTFDDEMLISTVTASTVAVNLLLSGSKSYGTSPTVSWDSTLKICTVTLGTSPTLVVGTTTVNPSALVKDTAGNADNSSAVTISTTTTVLSSVSISPATATGTVGTATSQSFTVSALSTAATTMTSSCTFTWSISPTTGRGSLSATSGTTVTYTLPATGVTAGAAVITVSAVKTGTTTPVKTDISTVTVSAAVASDTPDPTKLFVSTQNENTKYTDVPTGGNIKVYAFASDNADSAVAAGIKVTITLDDTWTASTAFGATDFIYFTLTNSDALTSAVTSDGQIPEAPTALALGSIQATGTTTVTSSADGNLTTGDSIKCYVGTTSHSAATNVGTDMTLTTALVAADSPCYTKTNTAGHESVVSSDDGRIRILESAIARNVNTADSLVAGDTITLIYSGEVNVNLPIDVSHLTWTASKSTAVFAIGSEELKGTDPTDTTEVLLTAVTVTDFADSAETITFNVPANVRIVDAAGGNFVLPWASDSAAHFDSADF
jgi:hypothetical protein